MEKNAIASGKPAVRFYAAVLLVFMVGFAGGPGSLFAADKQLPDMGITNDVHRANAGKIVFSTDVIDFVKPDPSAFKTSFTQDDNIYARFYLSESLENHIYHKKGYTVTYPKYECDLYIDGALQELVIYKGSAMPEATQTTRQLRIRVPRTASGWGDTGEWVRLVNGKVSPGKHKVRLDLKSVETGKVVASGEFTYVRGNTPAKYGTTFKDYKAGMNDKALEKSMFDAVKGELKWKELTWTGIKIASEDWTIVRDDFGNILSRGMDAWLHYKKNDGTFGVRSVTLGQEYNGKGYSKSCFVMKYENGEEVDE